mmetsp:Transcript_69389/g.136160  ORF Transcript_69389/g.136160 Transcript_69389/m.136160 type:complete len:213 (+) Transcript_69389:78-716(+)
MRGIRDRPVRPSPDSRRGPLECQDGGGGAFGARELAAAIHVAQVLRQSVGLRVEDALMEVRRGRFLVVVLHLVGAVLHGAGGDDVLAVAAEVVGHHDVGAHLAVGRLALVDVQADVDRLEPQGILAQPFADETPRHTVLNTPERPVLQQFRNASLVAGGGIPAASIVHTQRSAFFIGQMRRAGRPGTEEGKGRSDTEIHRRSGCSEWQGGYC